MHLVLSCTYQPAALRQIVPWAHNASDPSKLRSLLLNPSKFQATELYLQQCSHAGTPTYAVTRDKAKQGSERFCIYGNLSQQPDYEDACEQVITMSTTNTCRIAALPAAAVPAARAVFARHGYKELYTNPCWEYTLQGPLLEQLESPEFGEQLQQQLGSGFELGVLQHQDAEVVNDLWTYRAPGTLQVVQELIDSSHTSCIRSLPDRQPVAWMLETDPSMAGMLHTLQQHRRNGLARIVVLDLLYKLHKQHQQLDKEVLQQLQQDHQTVGQLRNGFTQPEVTHDGKRVNNRQWPGGHVYAYIVQENEASMALFESLGLTRSGEFWWVGFEKQ